MEQQETGDNKKVVTPKQVLGALDVTVTVFQARFFIKKCISYTNLMLKCHFMFSTSAPVSKVVRIVMGNKQYGHLQDSYLKQEVENLIQILFKSCSY